MTPSEMYFRKSVSESRGMSEWTDGADEREREGEEEEEFGENEPMATLGWSRR